jgi:uncharacterized protein Yka (UPF0111/DUF47 family)
MSVSKTLQGIFGDAHNGIIAAGFKTQAALARRATRTFIDTRISLVSDIIVGIEHEGDKVQGELHAALEDAFITHFPKGSAIGLMAALDDILDAVKKIYTASADFQIRGNDLHIAGIFETVEQVCSTNDLVTERLERIIGLLTSSKIDVNALRKLCEEVDELESETDALRSTARQTLNQKARAGELHFVTYAGMNEIIKQLEKVADHAAHAAWRALSMAQGQG